MMSWSGVDGWSGVVNGSGVSDGGVVNRSRLVMNRLVVSNNVLRGDCRSVVWDTSMAHCHQRTSYHDLMTKQTRLNN